MAPAQPETDPDKGEQLAFVGLAAFAVYEDQTGLEFPAVSGDTADQPEELVVLLLNEIELFLPGGEF